MRRLEIVAELPVLPAASVATARKSYRPSVTVVVSKETEYGEVVSAEPTFVHEPAPAGERWNCTWATYESASLAAEVCRLIVPVTGEPGSLIVAVGATSST